METFSATTDVELFEIICCFIEHLIQILKVNSKQKKKLKGLEKDSETIHFCIVLTENDVAAITFRQINGLPLKCKSTFASIRYLKSKREKSVPHDAIPRTFSLTLIINWRKGFIL